MSVLGSRVLLPRRGLLVEEEQLFLLGKFSDLSHGLWSIWFSLSFFDITCECVLNTRVSVYVCVCVYKCIRVYKGTGR